MDQIRHPDMITRETIDLETSQLLTYEDAPEKVCLLLPKSILKNSFDIGIIAYSVRGMKYKPQKIYNQFALIVYKKSDNTF